VINYQAVDGDGVRAEWVEAVAATLDQPTIILFYDRPPVTARRCGWPPGNGRLHRRPRADRRVHQRLDGVRAYTWLLGEGLDPDTTSFTGGPGRPG